MSDLESKVRSTLRRHADPPSLRTLPPATRRRIARRRATYMGGEALAGTAVLLAAVVLLGVLRHPADTAPAPPPVPMASVTGTSTSTSTSTPSTTFGPVPREYWSMLDPIARPTYGGDVWISPTFGGDFVPYVDVVDRNLGVIGRKWVLTYGTIGGDRFSMVVFGSDGQGDSYNEGGNAEFFFGYQSSGPGDSGAYGGGFGASADVPAGYDAYVASEPGRTAAGDRYATLLGAASPLVDHLLVVLEDGWTQQIPVLRDGPVDGAGWILAFVPAQTGKLIPVTADGTRLAPWPICVGQGAGEPPACPAWYVP